MDLFGSRQYPGAEWPPSTLVIPYIFRDSFGVHMAEYFAKEYPQVTLMDYRTEDCAAAVRELKPDVVVIEVAERYTDYMFGLLESLGTMEWE